MQQARDHRERYRAITEYVQNDRNDSLEPSGSGGRRPGTYWFQIPAIQLKTVIAQIAKIGLDARGIVGHHGHSSKDQQTTGFDVLQGMIAGHMSGFTYACADFFERQFADRSCFVIATCLRW